MSNESMHIAVAGLHLTGQPLNHQLVSLGATLVKTCRTSASYAMYLIEDEKGKKPGLVRLPDGKTGNAYEIEIWSLPIENVGKFLSFIPAPLGLGTLTLEDGSAVKGFICEHRVMEEGKDISGFPGWKSFMANANDNKKTAL